MRTILRLLKSTIMLALCSLVLLNGCAASEQNKVDAQNHRKPTYSKAFGELYNYFEPLTTCKINTCCIDATQSKKYKFIEHKNYQKVLANYDGPMIALGHLPDTLNAYALVYCTASAVYLPNIALFDKRGELLQTVLLASGCGTDVGYDCKEEVVFDGKNRFVTTKKEIQYQLDEMGNPNKERSITATSKIQYSIFKRHIAIDTLQ